MKAAALARIVHGDSHWQFSKCHIQLGKVYLELRGMECSQIPVGSMFPLMNIMCFFLNVSDLPEQALSHAVKGRDILLAPGSHVMSHDPSPEAIYNLAVAHQVVGRAFIIQGKYPPRLMIA